MPAIIMNNPFLDVVLDMLDEYSHPNVCRGYGPDWIPKFLSNGA